MDLTPHSSRYAVVLFVALVAAIVAGRELRPSEHGLAYQEDSPPPAAQNGEAQEMLSFFGATTSSTSSSTSTVELPEAKNISDTWRSTHPDGGWGSRDAGRDRVRLGLLVASGVCGLTGVVLLVVSGVVFLFRLQKRKLKGERIPSSAAVPLAFVAHGAGEKTSG